MELEHPLRIGYLFVPSQNFLRKNWIKKYCALYNASNHGIQRLEIFENEDGYLKQNPSKLIPLTDCIKVTANPQKQQANVFEVCTKSNTYQFSADNFQDMTEWLIVLQKVAFNTNFLKSTTNSSTHATKHAKEEENMLYSSMDEPEIFTVKAVNTPAIMRNGLQGDYKLIVTSVNFSIAEENLQGRIGRILFTWPYRHIRRYGCSKDNFSFEAGRKCISGEGLFTFATNEGLQIFQSVEGHMSALKALHGDIDVPHSPSHSEDKDCFFASKDSLLLKREAFNQKVSKLDSTFNSDSQFQTHKKSNILKPSCPLAKPPRKSKSNFNSSKMSDAISNINQAVNNDSSSYNYYEELYQNANKEGTHDDTDKSYVYSNQIHDPEYDKIVLTPSQKQSHTNFNSISTSLANETKEFHSSALNHLFPDKVSGDISSSHNYSNYDHLSPNTFTSSKVNCRNEGHIYGKISKYPTLGVSNANDSSCTKTSITENDGNCFYSNVKLPKSLATKNDGLNESKMGPDHFIKNDAEYAQIFKKNNCLP